jgi:uncharacterized membrane protein YbhN (UPF0104 family)
MQGKPRLWWRVVKALLSLAILAAVGWRFSRDLAQPELYARPVRVGWLVLAGLLYLVGMSLSGLYWRRLLHWLGASPTVVGCLRAYFVSQLGKYMPGKAWAMMLRVGLIRREGVAAALGGVTTFCEVLTFMGVGSLLSAVVFALVGPVAPGGDLLQAFGRLVRVDHPSDQPVDRTALVLLSLLFLAVTVGPIFPPLFNRIVDRLSIPFRSGPAPRLHSAWLALGLPWLAPAWCLFGLALACAFEAVPGAHLSWEFPTLARLTAAMALGYVAGFLLFTPGGLGVREFFLGLLLAPELVAQHGGSQEMARGRVTVVVLLLRLTWTGAELLAAGLYFWPAGKAESA